MTTLSRKQLHRLTRQAFCPSALTVLLAGLLPPSALAQPVDPGMRALEEVVVTARRREESLQEVPIAVTAMGAEYLRANNIAEFSDLRVHVPSLSIGVGGSSTNVPQVALRGLRPEEVLITLDPAVPMYFADVVMTPTHGTNLAMYDLANVQVLKGPQVTLFGRNSTGGAILVQPQTPGTELGGYVEARAGNYSLHGLEGAIDVPVNDRLQFRLAGRMLERDGYQSNVADNPLAGSDKFWDEDSSGGRLSVNLQVTDSLSNLLVVGYDQNDMLAWVPKPLAFNPTASLGTPVNLIHYGGLGIGGPAVDAAIARARSSSAHDVETDLNGHDEVENTVASNTTTWELGNGLTVKNIFGYRKVNYAGSNDSDGTALALFGSIADPDASGVTWDVTPRVVEAEKFTNELQLLGTSFDDRLQWLAGFYWYDMEATEIAPTMVLGANPTWPNTPPPSPSLAPIRAFAQNGFLQVSPNDSVQNKSYAVFAEGTYSLTDRLDRTLGVRQTWDERQVTLANERMGNCLMRDRNGNPLPNDACSRSESERFSSPSWRAVANYRLNDTSMVYGSMATGYRSGGFNARGTDNLSLQPFDEETVLTYELGHKADWSLANGATLRTSLAAYLSKYEDIQRTQDIFADGALATNVVNAAEAEVKGIELEALFRPTRNLEMMLAWSFIDMEYNWPGPSSTWNTRSG